jgi:hypothetical protein
LVLLVLKQFGTGIIISTAFVHVCQIHQHGANQY